MEEKLKKEIESLKEEILDIQDELREKDFQILHIMNALDLIKQKLSL